LMDTWVAFAFWLLWIMLLWTWVYKYLFESLFQFPEVESRLYSNSVFEVLRTHILFSAVAVAFCIPTKCAEIPVSLHPYQHFSVF
jgi:hypothetical protein